MSRELCEFLTSKGIARSRTTSYNPQGNGQTERYNGIIWRAITMALKSRDLPTKCWQIVLPDALHSIRSLLSTATNVTPHERLFNFARRSTTGGSLPTWLCMPGPVLLKRHVRHSKAEPLWTKLNYFKQIRSSLMSAIPMAKRRLYLSDTWPRQESRQKVNDLIYRITFPLQ